MAGVLGIVLMMAAPAVACTTQAVLSASSGAAPAGAEVQVTGNFFTPGGEIEVFWNALTGQVLARAVGPAFSVTVTIPLADPAVYFLVARQKSTDGQVIAQRAIPFEVVDVAPGASTGAAATAGNGQATVSWAAPASNGGSPVTGYAVTGAPGGQRCTTTGSLTCTVVGLTNGNSYTFTVVAINAVGPGPPSAATPAALPTDGLGFHSLTPARILDTRPAGPQVGPFGGQWAAGQTRGVTVTDVGGVPANAVAVTLNVTVTDTTEAGFLTIWPAGQAQPVASSLNWAPGQTVPNAVTVKVGDAGRVAVFNYGGKLEVVIDVVSYYAANTGSGFTSLTPARILDSRPHGAQVGPLSTPWTARETRDVTVAGVGGVPADADAVVVNVTVTGTTGAGFLTVWPAGAFKPLASSLNWAAGQTIPNAVTVKVGVGGKISVFNATSDAHVIVDVVGSFAPGTGSLFHPLAPARIQDSRPGAQVGPYATPWGANVSRDVQVTGAGRVPAGAAAVLMNVTVTGTTASSFLTVWPAGQEAPLASSLNWAAATTIPNSVTAKLGATGAVAIKNATGDAHVIADVAGWYG